MPRRILSYLARCIAENILVTSTHGRIRIRQHGSLDPCNLRPDICSMHVGPNSRRGTAPE